LNEHEVDYLVIGGHAVAYHGYPRATADLDVWVAVNPANALKLVGALRVIGFDVPELTPALFLQSDRVIRMGVPPNRIEIQTGIDGVQFNECEPRGVLAELDGVRVRFICLADLKTNKRASGRNKDLADLDQLP
jgi:hypothetical protein